MARTAEYGFWKSPFTSDLVAGESVRLHEPRIQGDCIHWLEGRPSEKGRSVLVTRHPDGTTEDALPKPWNIRTGVHEYGGGAHVLSDEAVYFSQSDDARVFVARAGAAPEPLVPRGKLRYADFELDPRRDRLLAVCEDHSRTRSEARQSIVAVDLNGSCGPPRELRSGADFYSNPRVRPDGRVACWLEWRHPNMPWDGTELWIAPLGEDGAIRGGRRIAGGPRESVFQPRWSREGVLHFVSDRTGYWNLYRWDSEVAVPLHRCEAEFGLPQWVFGMSTYGIAADGSVVCAYCEKGRWSLGIVSPGGALEWVETPYTLIDGVDVQGAQAVFRAASPTEPSALVRLDLRTRDLQILRRSTKFSEDLRRCLSIAGSVSFRSAEGRRVHGFYYPPHNPDFVAPEGEKPPVIIRLHGGPTAAASDSLSLSAQFWTSRGFGVLELNYGGSTGYGRAYRERLNGNWGVVDVDDTVAAARHLAQAGLADPDRIVVKGGSAGGYTVLCCLAFRDEFAAGASYYGISDLKALASDTHKFESRYHETLIGPWPAEADTYEVRSPLRAASRVSAPTIFFQGSVDPVVPKEQTEVMVDALRARDIPVAYYLFEGESHGFRDGAHIRRALEGELAFYCTVLLRKGVRF
ncbi:MAG: prolyl oligopeptidase family serine peptidase [Bryobacterales bacterium]|nr:prolyl oligopeptidase family serine peptidase [Bryobacterales bacterium]